MTMAGQQICLKWNSFQANIVTSFENLWEEEGLVDVTLASDGQCLRAHKVILSACSPFFRKVFQMNPCQHPVIILQDVHFSELESLLSFVYKGEVNIEQENLPALLRAAETLQIRGLSGASEQVKEKMCASSALLAPCSPASVGSGSEEPPPPKRLRSAAAAAPVPAPASLPPSSPSPPPPPGARSAPATPRPRRSSTPAAPLDLWGDPAVHADALALADAGGGGGGPKAEPSEPSEPPSPAGDALEDSADDASVGPPPELMQAAIKGEVQTGQMKGQVFADGGRFHADPSDASQAGSKSFPFPPFPCPFCDRAYTSWGFRRRHIKAMHTQSPRLSCKWCLQVLPSHVAWERHVMAEHRLSAGDAHNGLLILEEAHMVLQIPHPTRLDTFVSMIRKGTAPSAPAPRGSPPPPDPPAHQ